MNRIFNSGGAGGGEEMIWGNLKYKYTQGQTETGQQSLFFETDTQKLVKLKQKTQFYNLSELPKSLRLVITELTTIMSLYSVICTQKHQTSRCGN